MVEVLSVSFVCKIEHGGSFRCFYMLDLTLLFLNGLASWKRFFNIIKIINTSPSGKIKMFPMRIAAILARLTPLTPPSPLHIYFHPCTQLPSTPPHLLSHQCHFTLYIPSTFTTISMTHPSHLLPPLYPVIHFHTHYSHPPPQTH